MNHDLYAMGSFPFTGLYGLVVCGGNSERMGTDKSMLLYHGEPQRYHLYKLIQPFCEKVFISCNTTQQDSISAEYNLLVDLPQHQNLGPIAALLTAMNQHPGKNFLLIGCDYPYLRAMDIYAFLRCCDHAAPAAFFNKAANLYEPLIGFYPAVSLQGIAEPDESPNRSLQHFLQQRNAFKFFPANQRITHSVDTNEDFMLVKNDLTGPGKGDPIQSLKHALSAY